MKKYLVTGLLAFMTLPALAQQQFSTPEQAYSALTQAISTRNETQLSGLLGDDWHQYLPPEGVDPEAVARYLRDWQVAHHIVEQGNSAHLLVGQENWQLPIPMEKTAGGWQFDMAKAADEIQTREIGRNELAAIGAMHAWVDAEQQYYQMTQQWAKKIISSEGKKDGLYWPTKPGDVPSPIGPAYSPQVPGMGYHGYRFRIIDDPQAKSVALVASPVSWGESGVMSFMVNMDDTVYQANLGETSAEKAAAITQFAVNAPWEAVKE